jgi:hypothetical protein
MSPPLLTIELIKGNGIGPHGNGVPPMYPIGRGHTDTFYSSKPIGSGTLSMPLHGDRNNSMDTTFTCRHNMYTVEFQKYFLVKNVKVLLERQVPEYPHAEQRLVLNGQVLEDHRELSEYGITAATCRDLKVKLYLVKDFSSPPTKLPGARRDSDGTRTWVPVCNPTGLTGEQFSQTIGRYMP